MEGSDSPTASDKRELNRPEASSSGLGTPKGSQTRLPIEGVATVFHNNTGVSLRTIRKGSLDDNKKRCSSAVQKWIN